MRVLIVGGGVSGLYLSLLLSRQANTFDVLLLNRERSVGGRLLSYKSIKGEILEMGAMRIPSHHRHTLALCSDLGLELSLFNGTTLFEDLSNLTIDTADLDEGLTVGTSPSIFQNGVLRFCRIDQECEVPIDWLFIKLSLRLTEHGIELKDLSFAELVHLVLTRKEEQRFWLELGYDHLRFNDVSAIYVLANGFVTSKTSSLYYTVSTGMQSIANTLYTKVLHNGVRVLTNETVISVFKRDSGYSIKTIHGAEFYCDLLVFAIPPKEIIRLHTSNSFLDLDYRAALNDIGYYASTKTYATFPADSSFTSRLNSGFFTTSLPIRQCHFNPCGSRMIHNSHTILAEYRNLFSNHTDCTDTPSSIEDIVHCLNCILHTALDDPLFYSSLDWSNVQSCVTAHYWKTGSSPSKAIAKLQSLDANLGFTGEAISLGQGWVEGALDSSQSLCNSIVKRYRD